jgi:PilZ domain
MTTQMVDLRRHPRMKVSWPVTVEVGDARFDRQTIDLSPMGVKVALECPLAVGSRARILLRPPNDAPLEVDAIVWRADDDGPAFFFVGVESADVSLDR